MNRCAAVPLAQRTRSIRFANSALDVAGAKSRAKIARFAIEKAGIQWSATGAMS